MNLAIFENGQRHPTRMMRESNSYGVDLDYLTTKHDAVTFDRLYNGGIIQVAEYMHPVYPEFLNEKSLYASGMNEMISTKSSFENLKDKNAETAEKTRSQGDRKKVAIKNFARRSIDPNENDLKQTAKNEDFKDMKKWLEKVFQSIEACLECKKQQIENNTNLSQKIYNSTKKAQEKARRGVMKEIRELKKLHTKRMVNPENLRHIATELLMRVYENEIRNRDGFYINTMPRIPDTENAHINTSQHQF